MLSKSLLNPEAWIFMRINISRWKNVLIVTVPILVNKDVFEPNYNDLKFTVQTIYFCISLIAFI